MFCVRDKKFVAVQSVKSKAYEIHHNLLLFYLAFQLERTLHGWTDFNFDAVGTGSSPDLGPADVLQPYRDQPERSAHLGREPERRLRECYPPRQQYAPGQNSRGR